MPEVHPQTSGQTGKPDPAWFLLSSFGVCFRSVIGHPYSQERSTLKNSPCIRCGACCAMFCVSFPRQETNDMPGGHIPVEMTVLLPPDKRAMKGTRGRTPRCVALDGRVGFRVSCRIYKSRPSICREFHISWKNGQSNNLCDKARAVFGLQPFLPY